ncbi:MAG: 4-(cytidine 5'-diphospho)-2-C-methyl-D-erythritol kinase [Clostridia bacterium]|nr:4-(cytidine 5'-diphospho)-2-C-methyl-D-erythritol kinase [Clostridia bacterium]
MKILLMAAAKVNLTLDILGKRPDGYHDLKSIMQSVGIYDKITIEQNHSGKITIACSREDVPCDQRNIVYKCAEAFYKKIGTKNEGLFINIEKDIPTQAGMGGGSADGAAVLVGLNEMCGRPLDEYELEKIGAAIGADIPFCVRGGTVLCEGIGDRLQTLESIPMCWFAVVKPPVSVSTAKAYAAVDKEGFVSNYSTEKMLASLTNVGEIGANLKNDFEDTLNIDEVVKIKNELLKCDGCLGAVMSGSGSAVFGIFENKENAEKCTKSFCGRYSEVFTAEKSDFSVRICSLSDD